MQRRSRNPFTELGAIADLVRLYRRERPTLVHQVTVKPVLYGSLAASIARVPAVVNAVAGLGHVFVARGAAAQLMRWAISRAYAFVLSRPASRVIFQTEADRDSFVLSGIVDERRSALIRGAGVNIDAFRKTPELKGTPIVMFAGRILWNKGVGDLVEAGRILARQGIACRIVIVGSPDAENPMSVPELTLKEWQRDGHAEWWGKQDNMPVVLGKAAIIALPTYYGEGVPKILLEAAACGRAIVTTDLPGCRDVVRDGENGLIVAAQDPSALALALGKLLCSPEERRAMGARGREMVLREFTESRVIEQTLAVYEAVCTEARERGFR